MANSLFNDYGKNQNGSPLNEFGGQNGLLKAMEQASQLLREKNMTPEQLGKELLSSGRMSPDQFNQYRKIANAITGKNY